MKKNLIKFLSRHSPIIIKSFIKWIVNKSRWIKLSPPIVQIYINDEKISSFSGVNNFFSILAPRIKNNSELFVDLYAQNGNLIVSKMIKLTNLSSSFIDVNKLLQENNKESNLGLITIIIKPNRPWKDAYKKLGNISSHFFMFYRGISGSVAMVHPSSSLDPMSPSSGPFITNQIIDTFGLKGITLYQCNPSQNMHELNIGLLDVSNDEVLCSKQLNLKSLSVHSVFFETEHMKKNGINSIRAFTTSLPTANSKPMICRHYYNNKFSISHS